MALEKVSERLTHLAIPIPNGPSHAASGHSRFGGVVFAPGAWEAVCALVRRRARCVVVYLLCALNETRVLQACACTHERVRLESVPYSIAFSAQDTKCRIRLSRVVS